MTRDEWRLCEERFASRGIDMAAASRGAAFFSKMQKDQPMPDLTAAQLQRLTAARFDGPQALFTEAVRLLSERPALPDDLAGLVARLRKESDDARDEFAEQWADAEYTGERPDLEPITAELTVERIEEAADAIEALVAENARLSASEPKCMVVKPLGHDGGSITLRTEAEVRAEGMRIGAAMEKMRALTEWLNEDECNGELLMDSLDAKTTETLREILHAITEVRK